MKKLLVISGKGGTGKTTVSSALIHNLSVKAFADCDVDAPNLHLLQSFSKNPEKKNFIGAEKAKVNNELCTGCGLCLRHCRFDAVKITGGKADISEYACEGCGVCEYLCPQKAIDMTPDIAGELYLYKDELTFSTAELKMGRGNSGKLVTEVKSNLFSSAPSVPIAVLDGSPGTGCPVMASLSGADMALVVTEPTLSGKSDLQRVIKTISLCGVKAAVCINKYDVNTFMSTDIENWCGENNIPFAGKIPYDKQASAAVNEGKSLAETDCPAADALKEICNNVYKLLQA